MATLYPKSSKIDLRLTPEERAAARLMARLEGLDMSAYLRQLIRTDAKRRQLPDIGSLTLMHRKDIRHDRTPQQP